MHIRILRGMYTNATHYVHENLRRGILVAIDAQLQFLGAETETQRRRERHEALKSPEAFAQYLVDKENKRRISRNGKIVRPK